MQRPAFDARFWKLTCTWCGNFRNTWEGQQCNSKISFQKVTQKSVGALNIKMKVVTIINRRNTSVKHIFAEQYWKTNKRQQFNLINRRRGVQKTTTADLLKCCGILRRFDILCRAKIL
jgi:hypothetical protein